MITFGTHLILKESYWQADLSSYDQSQCIIIVVVVILVIVIIIIWLEINNQRSCEISELLNDTKNLLNSWTANQTSDDEEDDGEQGDDESDLLVLFDSLGKRLKTFQRDLASTDKKVENAKKTSSPLRKRRRKRR